MKHHTDNGDELIRAAYPDVEDNTFVKVACDVVRSHHEDWDGSGYPDGLKGSDIPLSARIVKSWMFMTVFCQTGVTGVRTPKRSR